MKRFVAELIRRKVLRVTAAYLVVGFAVLEAADILRDTMRLPPQLLHVVTLVLILGIPLTVALTWIFEISSSGVRRTQPAADAESVSRIWPITGIVLLSTLALGATTWVIPEASRGRSRPEPSQASIAVLPFVNLSGDPANDYFGDGLAEELTNTLSHVGDLRVAARTSSFAFKGRQIDAMEIGDILGVAALLEGSVRRQGSRVRIGAQLIRAVDGLSLWSQAWERELTSANVFAIQDEITHAIAGELERELLPGSSRLAERRTDDIEAYDLYLLGRHQWAKRTADGLSSAISFFEQAIERDSSFALAWAGLADSWEARPFFDSSVTMAEAERAARPAAEKALDLASHLAESHAALGVILSDYDFDYPAAISRLNAAVELNPNYAQAWSWLCVAQTMSGDPTTALASCDRAVALDPLSPIPRVQRGLALMVLDRHEEALYAFVAGDDLGPLSWVLAVATRLQLGQTDEIDEDLVRTGAALGLPDPQRMRSVAATIRGEGGRETSLAILHDLEAAHRIGFLELAPLYAWVGAPEEAWRVFAQAIAERDPWLPFAGSVTSFAPLHQDPRFAAALDSLGIRGGRSAE
ncbi:MAG: hypothetical protein ABFS14_12120 [Gemmatimonadota bacterium]